MKNKCKRCLLAEAGEKITAQEIRRQLSLISFTARTDSREYNRRLKICTCCSCLIGGTCTRCGCYVEYRAGISKNHCPDTNKKW